MLIQLQTRDNKPLITKDVKYHAMYILYQDKLFMFDNCNIYTDEPITTFKEVIVHKLEDMT